MKAESQDFPIHIVGDGKEMAEGGLGYLISFDNLEIELKKKGVVDEDVELRQITILENGVMFVFEEETNEES